MSNERDGRSRLDRRGVQQIGRERPWGLIVVGAAVVVVLATLVVVIALDSRQRSASDPPEGITSIDVGASGSHTTKDVNYEQAPPAGGQHDPVWQNCGFYTHLVGNENAVHSLEHGAVWITYRLDLPRDQKQRIGEITDGQTYVLVSPYERLPAPVVASAWGKQLRLDSADDPRLEQFIRAYRQGPQTPESGAACTDGTGTPS